MNRKVILALLISLTILICSLVLYFALRGRKEVVELKNNEVIVNTQEKEVKENVNNEQKEENNSNEEISATDEDIKTQETEDTTIISLDNDDVEITYNDEVIDHNETIEINLDNNGHGISVEDYAKENCNHCYLDKYEEGESIIYVHPITDEEVIFIITGNEDYYVSNLDFFSSSNLSLEEAFKEIEDLDFINLTEYLES